MTTSVVRAAIIAACLVGCAVEHTSSTAGISFEELRASAGIEPGTGGYIVDWDVVIHGDDALYAYWAAQEQGALLIFSNGPGGTQIKWNATQKLNLTYCVGASFGARTQQVIQALEQATTNGWSKMANVRFVHVAAEDANCTASNGNVLFDVNLVNSGGQFLARAFFPDQDRATRNLLVDPDSFDAQATGNIPLANILIHEAGHILGFRHEHIARPGQATQGCVEDGNYTALTPYDQQSTMHYPQCGNPGTTLALSSSDRTGASAVYGAPIANESPMTMVSAPITGATVPPTFDVVAAVVDTDLVSAELVIDAVSYQTKTAAPFTFKVTNLAEGAHTLVVQGKDAAGQTSKQMINVIVKKGSGGDDGDVTGGCTTSSGAGALLALGLLGLRRRRR
jgi:MYXO-CTERM domain-containing protein